MTEHELAAEADHLTKFQQHKFMVMVAGTIVVSLVLVAISLYLYAVSGAEQLDLSRPGYRAISKQVANDEDFDGFPASGSIDKSVTEDFLKRYDEKAKKLTTVDGFGGNAMSDKSLSLELPQ